ncbi:hypothetical protein [Streptomyces sp. NPDC002553]|uniref:hypothetical protein n=1 Tax=Streptomyces sp. NPDC002553 TaxID=3154417 RepID=UPI0033238C49
MARVKSETSADSIWPPAEFLDALSKLNEGDKGRVLDLIRQQVQAGEREDRRRAWIAGLLGFAFAGVAFYMETRGDPYVCLGVIAVAAVLVWWLMSRPNGDAASGRQLALVRGLSQGPPV